MTGRGQGQVRRSIRRSVSDEHGDQCSQRCARVAALDWRWDLVEMSSNGSEREDGPEKVKTAV